MTDDFQLFPSAGAGDAVVDPDVALIMAYLARELTPVQNAAVEERLASDAAFCENVWPVMEAWFLPRSFGSKRAVNRRSAQGGPHRRSVPFGARRIAAVVAMILLPMAGFAQAVVYSAGHAGAPGHALAQRIVAAVSEASARPEPRPPMGDAPRPSPLVLATAANPFRQRERSACASPCRLIRFRRRCWRSRCAD